MSVDIDIDLTPEQENELVEMYVQRMMSEESISLFNEKRASGAIEQALFDAVINECAIIVMKAMAGEQNESEK